MGGNLQTISANTLEELKQKAQAWIREAKAAGLTDIRRGWDESRVKKTKNGYKIQLWAHS